MSYPHVTQFETVDRRARLTEHDGHPRTLGLVVAIRRRLRLGRRLAPQAC